MSDEYRDSLESSLESPDDLTVVHQPSSTTPMPQDSTPISSPRFKKPGKRTLVTTAIVLLAIALLFGVAQLRPDQKPAPTPITIQTQSLDVGTLNRLKTETGAEDTKETLIITPDSIFQNTLVVQKAVTTEDDLTVGGRLTVRGTTTLQQAVTINSNLAIRGNLSIGGALSAPALNIGTLNSTDIKAGGNVEFGGHLIPSGGVPTARASVAAGGGNVTVSGSDTAGTVTITMGNSPIGPGELAIITFRTRFSTTVKVQLTPVNGAAANLNYYTSRNAGFFTIETASPPAAGASYVFDYLVTQ